MPKSNTHKLAQNKAAGKQGRTEVKIGSGKKILDAVTASGEKITEVEKTGNYGSLKKAAERLKLRRSKQKVLQVPQKDMPKAAKAMREIGVKGTIKNMSNTKRRSV